MHIVAMVHSTTSKKVIKTITQDQGFSLEWVHQLDDLTESAIDNPDFIILEAQYSDMDYEDVLEELHMKGLHRGLKILLINNTADDIHSDDERLIVVDEYALQTQLAKHLVKEVLPVKRILYASDDRFMHRVIGDLLRSKGFEVIAAFDGLDALNKYENEHPHLVLTDLDMPGLTGLELCKAITIQNKDLATPVIILSGSYFEEDVQMAYNYRAKAYLTKPVYPDKLLKKIGDLIH